MSRSTVEQARPAGAEAQQRLRERLAEIQAMPVRELQDLYYDLHGRATRARNRPWLIKRLSYRTQELMTGLSLSAEAEQRIADLGEDEVAGVAFDLIGSEGHGCPLIRGAANRKR